MSGCSVLILLIQNTTVLKSWLFQMLSAANGSLLLIIFVIVISNAALDRWQP